jgi:hypothetical protein
MKGKTLTFHDEKKVAITRDTIGQAAMNAAFFMVNGILWLFFLPYEFYLKLERSLKALKK